MNSQSATTERRSELASELLDVGDQLFGLLFLFLEPILQGGQIEDERTAAFRAGGRAGLRSLAERLAELQAAILAGEFDGCVLDAGHESDLPLGDCNG